MNNNQMMLDTACVLRAAATMLQQLSRAYLCEATAKAANGDERLLQVVQGAVRLSGGLIPDLVAELTTYYSGDVSKALDVLVAEQNAYVIGVNRGDVANLHEYRAIRRGVGGAVPVRSFAEISKRLTSPTLPKLPKFSTDSVCCAGDTCFEGCK